MTQTTINEAIFQMVQKDYAVKRIRFNYYTAKRIQKGRKVEYTLSVKDGYTIICRSEKGEKLTEYVDFDMSNLPFVFRESV